MTLKFRYASYILLVLFVLVLFSATAVYFLLQGNYLLVAALLAILYLTTYQLGKKVSKIFITLSFLRMIKQHNGVISIERYRNFIDMAFAKRRDVEEKERLTKEILEMLEEEGIVTIMDSTIMLSSQ